MSFSQCCYQGPFPELQPALLVRYIGAQIFLQVGALMIVDADASMTSLGGQVGHQGCLAAGGGTLQQERLKQLKSETCWYVGRKLPVLNTVKYIEGCKLCHAFQIKILLTLIHVACSC